jgi:hypothetical protein
MQSIFKMRAPWKGLVALVMLGGAVSCSDAPLPQEETNQSPGQVGAALTDDAFRTAAACAGCSDVRRSNQVVLPLTGRKFTRAKLLGADGSHKGAIALDERGATVDADALVAAEGARVIARQGKLRDELHALSRTSAKGLVPVWIWADVREDFPPKELLLVNSAVRDAYEAKRVADVRAATSKIIRWLDERGYTIHEREANSPAVLADVPVSALAEIGRLDGVAVAGYRIADRPAATDAWFDTVKATAAQRIVASAAGQKFCNAEGYQPDDYSRLSLPFAYQLASPGGASSPHTRWTTELVAGQRQPPALGGKLLAVAPNATIYIANSDQFPGGDPGVWEWCWGQSANAMNESVQTSLAAGGLTAKDMTTDYYVKHSPYPLITMSAGNCSSGNVTAACASVTDRTVGNRGFNFLVVGASNDKGTTGTGDDSIADFSAWTNWQSPHHDYELPHLVAPGVDIDSASAFNGGTSASAPITLGALLLARTRDAIYGSWPEMARASVLATATRPVDGVRTTSISGATDLKQGAGLLNVNALVTLAASANLLAPNSAAAKMGHWAATYTFSTDFPGGSSAPYFIKATTTGRVRAVISWDSTAVGCSTVDGTGCTGDALDADLDLVLSKMVNGQWVVQCYSSSWDSSWELCDVPATNGDNFKVHINPASTTATSTYLGIAWYNYATSSE